MAADINGDSMDDLILDLDIHQRGKIRVRG
jgi:hypothetical protein